MVEQNPNITEESQKKRKTLKVVLLSIVGAIGLLLAIIIILAVIDLKQEEVLKQEIINYSNMDLIQDDYSIKVKTKGDCAYVEEAIKNYYKKLSDNMKSINKYLSNDELNSVLSYQNLVQDRPSFKTSKQTIKNTKENINKYIDNINNLVSEKTIKSLIDKEKLDDGDYYYDLYLQLIYTDQDKEDYKEIAKDMTGLKKSLNKSLDKLSETIEFLKKKDKNIVYKNSNLYFDYKSDLNKYRKYLEELEKIGQEITSEGEKITT